MKRLLRNLEDCNHWKGVWYISAVTHLICYGIHYFMDKLLAINYCFTHFIGTEFQAWLLWYSVPVLDGILPDPYYVHHCKLVAAISTLLGTQMSVEEVENASNLLEQYYKDTDALYGILKVFCI